MSTTTIDRSPVRQTPCAAKRPEGRTRVSAAPSLAPAFLNARQAAELLGVSERKFAELRRAGVVPDALELGPRALRWRRDELLEHVGATAPRVRVYSEPAHLRLAKEEVTNE